MKTVIEVPSVGESVSGGILAAWLKKDGDHVSEGDELFELETDKATLAVPSPATGVLRRGAAEGDEVTVGESVGHIETADGGRDGADGPAAGSPAEPVLSPAVRRVVTEHGLDPSTITGTGPKGRITRQDALEAAAQTSAAVDGRTNEARAAAAPAGQSPAPAPPATTGPRQRRVPLSTLRRRIGENLVRSRQSSAHVTTFNEVDMSAIADLRTRHRDAFQERHGIRLGLMSFFVKASEAALLEFPEVNAYLDGTDVLYNDYINIGVALSSEKGLLTPVIRDVPRLGFAEVERQIADFIARANDRKLLPDEMVGATFTISNGGVFGSLLSTPIPSPPQTAVLGMHAIQKRPVVVDDQIVVRPMMYLALTYDHRMIDGREAVLFLGTVKRLVEDPSRLLLGL